MSLYTATTRRCLLLLERCKNMQDLKQAHASIVTTGLGSNSFALSRVLEFCSNPHHGNPFHAWKIFQHIHKPTICIWNTILKAFLLHNELIQTILVYRNLLQSGIAPDNYTLPYVLKACSRLKSVRLGDSVHGYGMKLGLVFDIFVSNSLIVMYSEFRNMKGARYVFDEMPNLSVVSWTVMISGYAKVGEVDNARLFFDVAPVRDRGIWGAMISGYVQNACFKEGLYLFRVLLQLRDIEPDEAIFVSILCGCAHLGALDVGIWIHRYLDRLGLPLSIRLGTSLIDMYAKCGNLDLAKRIFYEMPQKDTVCWNAMISAMAINGDGETALELFRDMEKTGVPPDDITFIAIFTACSYSGMTYIGLLMFEKMLGVYRIEPKTEHYGCIVDLLSRAGFFEEAKQIVQRVIISSNPSEEEVAWRAFLSACCTHGQAQLAELAFGKLSELECGSGLYVLLSNLYASAGKDADAGRVRKLMKHRGVEKVPGCSLIEINGGVHEFIAGEKIHPQMEDIHSVLEKLNKHLIIQGTSHTQL